MVMRCLAREQSTCSSSRPRTAEHSVPLRCRARPPHGRRCLLHDRRHCPRLSPRRNRLHCPPISPRLRLHLNRHQFPHNSPRRFPHLSLRHCPRRSPRHCPPTSPRLCPPSTVMWVNISMVPRVWHVRWAVTPTSPLGVRQSAPYVPSDELQLPEVHAVPATAAHARQDGTVSTMASVRTALPVRAEDARLSVNFTFHAPPYRQVRRRHRSDIGECVRYLSSRTVLLPGLLVVY